MPAVSCVANVLGALHVFGTLGNVMVLGGDWMSVLVDGGSVAHEKILARCRRADNCSSVMGGKVLTDTGARERWLVVRPHLWLHWQRMFFWNIVEIWEKFYHVSDPFGSSLGDVAPVTPVVLGCGS